MTLETTEILLLSALFQLAQADRAATLIRLASHTQLSREAALAGLARLAAAGWVDGERLRLTLPGLALAAGLYPRVRASQALAA